MLRRFSTNFALFSMLLDGVSVALSLYLAVILRPLLNNLSNIKFLPQSVKLPLLLYGIFPVIWVLIYAMLSIYDGKRYLRVVDEFTALSLAMVLAAISTAGVLYLSFRDVSRALFLIFILIAYLSCLSWRILIRVYFRSQNIHPDRSRRILIVGAGPLGQNVKAKLCESDIPNLQFVGFVDESAEYQSLGSPSEIQSLIHGNDISDIIIALPYSEYHQMTNINQYLEAEPVQIWVALGFFDLALYKTEIEDFAGIPMLDLRASAINDYQRMMKRAFDLCLTLVLLVLALPFMAVSSLLIYLEDGAPILFRQKRVGENGREFEMLKFRTMVKNAESLRMRVEKSDENGNLIHKSRNDPRVTRVGRLLRRFSLDELPQLFNILAGTMSLVGPRPEMPYLVDKYQPWQRKRFAIPPGLTGWWQVSGRSDKPMHLFTEDDLYYIQNYSVWLDIQIILKTVWVVLLGKGAY
jgi:exopolysaccharide biosynthesis polyprenyl glycosylphosphotransferase